MPAGPEACRDAALRLLRQRQRSVAELRRRLAAQGHEPTDIEAVLERLQAVELLDDEAFAVAWVRDGWRLKGRGRLRLRLELLEFGLAPELIDAVLDRELPPAAEIDLARAQAAKRAGQLRGLPREVARRRLAAWLRRRGLPDDLLGELLDEHFPAIED